MLDSEMKIGLPVTITEDGIRRCGADENLKSLLLDHEWLEFVSSHIGEEWIVADSETHFYGGLRTYYFEGHPEEYWALPALLFDYIINSSDDCSQEVMTKSLFE